MIIEIKRSIKPVNYDSAIKKLEERVGQLIEKKSNNELIWFLEHPSIFTGGSTYKNSEIFKNLDIFLKKMYIFAPIENQLPDQFHVSGLKTLLTYSRHHKALFPR